MVCRVCVLLIMGLATECAFSQELDKAKLRALEEMPQVSLMFFMDFNSQDRDKGGNKIDLGQKIDELKKKLEGSIQDAEVYLDLASCYGDMKSEAKRQEMAGKAEALLRPHLQTTDPKEANLLCLYASALAKLRQGNPTTWERWALRTAQLAPEDWRSWRSVAYYRMARICQIVLTERYDKTPIDGRRAEFQQLLVGRQVPQAVLDEAEKCLTEARRCHERAKQLAPDNGERQGHYLAFCLEEVEVRDLLKVAQGQPPRAPNPDVLPAFIAKGFNPLAAPIDQYPQIIEEMQSWATLCPDHFAAQAMAAQFLIGRATKKNLGAAGPKFNKGLVAEEKDLKNIKASLRRLEQIANQAKGEAAIYLNSLLILLHFTATDVEGTEKYCRRVLEIDPKHRQASEILEFCLEEQERPTEALHEARRRLKLCPSGHSHYLLARVLERAKQTGVEEEIRAGLKLDGDDPHCLLGLAALRIRHGDEAGALEEAGRLLQKTRLALKPGTDSSLFDELDFLQALHQGLTGETLYARLTFQRLRQEHPNNAYVEKALAALGK